MSEKQSKRKKRMIKRLLLVDDEKFFLEGLKESLSKYKNIFTTDICFSVKEAIDLYKENQYELIISDIRMPKKSGLDLFVYLKDQDYHGGFIAMTAYGSPEVLKKIKSLGGLEVILKPFNLSWFTEKVLDFFEEEEGVSGTIDSIALTSLLQMINLEKKTLTVKVENQTSVGFLYFAKGEIVHAEYQGETGEKAAFQLITLKRGRFSLLNPKEKKIDKETIDTPFMVLMMNVMKTADENKKNIILADKNKNYMDEEVNMDIKKLKEALEYLKEQLGKGLVHSDIWATADGQPLVGYNSQTKAAALFNQLTQQIADALHQSEEDYVELGRYYLIDLVGDHTVIILYLGEYQWGILFNKKDIQLGLLLNVVIPQIIDVFEEAITG
jgi:YesN/AraC family two-component response regulator